MKKESSMATDGRKTTLPEQKRLVAEVIRKLTDARLEDSDFAEKSAKAGAKTGKTASRQKSARSAERARGPDA